MRIPKLAQADKLSNLRVKQPALAAESVQESLVRYPPILFQVSLPAFGSFNAVMFLQSQSQMKTTNWLQKTMPRANTQMTRVATKTSRPTRTLARKTKTRKMRLVAQAHRLKPEAATKMTRKLRKSSTPAR